MTDFPPALPHGPIHEVFPDVFFVTGTMRGEFFGSMWQFNRNMIIVREGERLGLVNAVRLDDEGLAALEALGEVAHVVRLGAMHGRDDAFYVDRYHATYWALPGAPGDTGVPPHRELVEGGELPFAGASLFAFRTTKLPEGILVLDRAGGIAIACDSLQNWVEPDALFLDDTVATMRSMGFFTPANLGPAWMMVSEPKAEDFVRLKAVPFRHALCGHGQPLRDDAQAAYHATFERIFGV
jgi:hypothetical protein